MIKLNLKEIEARVKAATPGPWVNETAKGMGLPMRIGNLPKDMWIGQIFSHPKYVYHDIVGDHGEDDAKFIAAARTDVPLLVECVRSLLEFIDYATQYTEEESRVGVAKQKLLKNWGLNDTAIKEDMAATEDE